MSDTVFMAFTLVRAACAVVLDLATRKFERKPGDAGCLGERAQPVPQAIDLRLDCRGAPFGPCAGGRARLAPFACDSRGV